MNTNLIENNNPLSPKKKIFSVGELNHQIKSSLNQSFNTIWLQGEISNCVQPRSGHCYFYLKDEAAQIRCVLFKMNARLLPFPLKNGLQVIAHAAITLYEPRGDLQLTVMKLEAVGAGNLQLAFEALKQKLFKEGLFDTARKKSLPKFPKRVGVITSPTGAAINDIKTTFKRRFPLLPLTVYPSQVQGDTAPGLLAKALQQAINDNQCDALIIARGGGSVEDLWAFNDETLARLIAQCSIPIISGIGHEIDFTITDFVSDIRAATPTAAAELVTPSQSDWRKHLIDYQQKIRQTFLHHINKKQQQLDLLHQNLIHPKQHCTNQKNKLKQLVKFLSNELKQQLLIKKNRYCLLHNQLKNTSPSKIIQTNKNKITYLLEQLNNAFNTQIKRKLTALEQSCQALELSSPLNTLKRGYTLTYYKRTQPLLLTSVQQIKKEDKLTTQVKDGKITSIVKDIEYK